MSILAFSGLRLTKSSCHFSQAAFVPTSESALDTSYFTSRYSWNTTDENIYPASDFEDSSDADSLSGSSSCLSNRQEEVVYSPKNQLNGIDLCNFQFYYGYIFFEVDLHNKTEQGDECGGLAEFESGSSVNYSFSNFSFKVGFPVFFVNFSSHLFANCLLNTICYKFSSLFSYKIRE